MNNKFFNCDISSKTSEICLLLFKSAIEDINGPKLVTKFKDCFKHVETLISCQKEYSIFNDNYFLNRAEKLEVLLTKINNKQVIDISKSTSGNGYGLVALENIKKYDEIIRISETEMITANDAYNSSIGDFLRSDKIALSMPNIALALFVLNEAYNSNSIYSSYIESLPRHVDTYLFLTPDDISMLQSSQYLNEIVQQFCNICSHYCYFFRIISQHKDLKNCHFKERFCFEDFRWAVSIIMSRNNAIPCNNGQSRTLALVPVWDMMNHQYGEVTTDFDDETKSLVFYAMQDYERGDEICMDYGKRSSLQYFMFSGFVPANNPYDRYPLKIGFNRQDQLYEKKRQLLALLGIDCNSATFDIDYLHADVIDKSMKLFLAVMLTKSGDQLSRLLDSKDTESEILEYSGQMMTEIESFMVARLKMNLSCIDRTLGKVLVDKVRVECLDLVMHEKAVLEQMLAKFD